MNFPQSNVLIEIRLLRLIDLIEPAASVLRANGKESEAVDLFRLRAKIREGLSFEESKPLFDKYTKNLFGEKI